MHIGSSASGSGPSPTVISLPPLLLSGLRVSLTSLPTPLPLQHHSDRPAFLSTSEGLWGCGPERQLNLDITGFTSWLGKQPCVWRSLVCVCQGSHAHFLDLTATWAQVLVTLQANTLRCREESDLPRIPQPERAELGADVWLVPMLLSPC